MSQSLSAVFCLSVQKTQRRFSLNTLRITQRRGAPPSIYAIVAGIINLSLNDFCTIEYHRERIGLGFLSWVRVNHHLHYSEIMLTLPSAYRLRSNIKLIEMTLKEAIQQLFQEQIGFCIDFQFDKNPVVHYYTGQFSPLEVLNVLSKKFKFDFLFDMATGQMILSIFRKGGFRYQTLEHCDIKLIGQDYYCVKKNRAVYLSMSYQKKPINRIYLFVSMRGDSNWQYYFSTQEAILSNASLEPIGYTGLHRAQMNNTHQIQLDGHQIKALYRSAYQQTEYQTMPPMASSWQYISQCADDFLPLHYGAASLARPHNHSVHYQLDKQTFTLNKQGIVINTRNVRFKASIAQIDLRENLAWQSAMNLMVNTNNGAIEANSKIHIECGQSSITLTQGVITFKARSLCIN